MDFKDNPEFYRMSELIVYRKTVVFSHWVAAFKYWSRSNNRWAVKVKTIGDELHVSRGNLLGIIRGACRAESRIHVCPRCGTRRSYESRYDFDEADHKSPWICSACTVSNAQKHPD
jgi:hypothetical protein